MDLLEELFGPPTDMDRLAEQNLAYQREWLARLVEIRREKGLTQAQVGDAMGISQSGVARLESGDRDLHLSSLSRYALAVGATVRHVVNPFVPQQFSLESDDVVEAEDWTHDQSDQTWITA